MNRELSLGEELEFACARLFSLEMSPGGGRQGKQLVIKAGTKIVVARNCGLDHNVPFHFKEEALRKQGRGEPFYTQRSFLQRATRDQGRQ